MQRNRPVSLKKHLWRSTKKRSKPALRLLLSLRFNVPAVRLELFDAKAISKAKLDGHSIIRFEIDDVVSTFDIHADGSQVADVKLAAVTLSNTRPGASLYRDFLPRSTSEDSQM
jgi:vacuolar protein sorting-associated protein 13A/C